ncbi:membrane fusion protein, multidrug efflux system [Colwellia chukchiensis]|uniref:Membrane fusion protein, multidrug efflux system n=1 Tax=Colwellia chukchiensis TaxID=641665 RepID=A0A1H7S3F4_9GAMM|nr:efflux RND transporter periplasmic adaptor subunit [Colwellia chukchiensis]SEL67122.1 membrane fusion protein, multidrug efflux system [Colwellia chukchiensis]
MLIQLQNKFTLSSIRLVTKCVLLSVLCLLSACGDKQSSSHTAPPPAVSTYQVNIEKIGQYREFVARTMASRTAQLIARVEGELIAQSFKEGSVVSQGQVLFKIDPTAYISALASAKADLASKIAGAQGAARDLKRGRDVAKQGYISQSDLDRLITKDAQAKAAVNVAKAALAQAELNLSYTTIKAPFSGHIGQANYGVGNIVGPQTGALAVLTATDPIYVSFGFEESNFITYLQNKRNNQTDADDLFDIRLRLPNNTMYPQAGKIFFADTKIEQGMGNVELRAEFANPDAIILPGLFVTLIVETKAKSDMALIPQAAVQENQQGKFVLVVDSDNKVVQRIVTLGRRINAMWAVESGLKAGERVIIEGLQKVRNGIVVTPVNKQVDPLTGVITDQPAQ